MWTSAVVMVLAVYLDNVLSSPTGTSQPWNYFLRPSYWRSPTTSAVPPPPPPPSEEEAQLSPDSPRSEDGATPAAGETTSYDASAEDPDVRREREAVDAGARDDRAVVLRHLRKTFKKLVAVDDVSVSIPHHSLFCLLGHNGAGKSTMFNMLTGLTDITSGDATVYGHSVRDDMAALRPLLGVCPQHDILFDRLTGAEHVRLFAALKGVAPSEREAEVSRRLEQVSLTDVGDRAAGLYSGGMRRRLSVALALVADPKIVFLDGTCGVCFGRVYWHLRRPAAVFGTSQFCCWCLFLVASDRLACRLYSEGWGTVTDSPFFHGCTFCFWVPYSHLFSSAAVALLLSTSG